MNKIYVKWYSPKKQYRLYCTRDGFRNQPYLTKEEVDYFRKHHPEMISKDSIPIIGTGIQNAIYRHFNGETP
jgi:hypothetical protein